MSRPDENEQIRNDQFVLERFMALRQSLSGSFGPVGLSPFYGPFFRGIKKGGQAAPTRLHATLALVGKSGSSRDVSQPFDGHAVFGADCVPAWPKFGIDQRGLPRPQHDDCGLRRPREPCQAIL